MLDDVYSYGRIAIENNYFNFASNDDFNLVYPNIYIGNYSTSTNLALLQGLGITHIISVIPSFNPPFLNNFKYLHIPAYDDQSQDMTQYFKECNTFIANILKDEGKVLIHCMVGRSRSITIFLAFLINILCGNFNQKCVKIYSENDVSNGIECKKFFNFRNADGTSIYKKNGNGNASDYNKTDYIKPELCNKYHNFMNYKKESMISEVDDLIIEYKLMQKKQAHKHKHIINNDSTNDSSNDNIYESNLMLHIMQYIKKYRKTASPNPFFVSQLIKLLK